MGPPGLGRGRARRANATSPPLPGFNAPSASFPRLPLPGNGVGVMGDKMRDLGLSSGEDEGLPTIPSPLSFDSSSDQKSETSSVSYESAESGVGRVTTIAGPLAPGKTGRPINVTTNIYDLVVGGDGSFHRYHVDVEAVSLTSDRSTDLGKGAGNDHLLNKKRELCYRLFRRIVADHREYFPEPAAVAYDRRNLIISRHILDFDGSDSGRLVVELGPGDLKGVTEKTRFTFKIEYESKLNLRDYSGLVNPVLEQRDRQVVQMLEIIVCQILFSNEGFVHFGCKSYVRGEHKHTDLGNGRFFASGVHHSLTVTSDPETGNPMLSLLWDTKSGAFYKPQSVMETLAETLSTGYRYTVEDFRGYSLAPSEHKKALANFRDVNVLDKAMSRNVTIDGLSTQPASELTVSHAAKPGQKSTNVPLPAFYRDVLKTPLDFPQLPCFFRRLKEGKKAYHPMEVCWVNECQRVPLPKQTPQQMQIMIRHAVKSPQDMQAELAHKARQTKIQQNETLAAMGLQMQAKSRVVKGRVIPAPAIKYSGGGTAPKENGDWRMPERARFLKGGRCGKWKALALVPLNRAQDIKAMEGFVTSFKGAATNKGLTLGLCSLASVNPAALEATFKSAAEEDFFLCIISDSKESGVRDKVKMLEHRYGILTQCVTVKRASEIGANARGSGQVLENILNKTNMKMGGINYHLDSKLSMGSRWLKGDVMLLGCDVNHPPPQPASLRHLPPREPSVVGFVCNSPADPHLFTGEIAYQNPRQEMVQTMPALVHIFAKRWTESPRALPKEIVYFRDGVSDGQFQQVLENEVDELRAAFKAFAAPKDYSPLITVVIAKKRHNLRMFDTKNVRPGMKARDQDLPPGTVLDSASGVTHPGQANLYLKSHSALQGTARATHYTMPLNEGGYSEEELEDMINTLAHGHQIVSKPTSLPAPVYGAHEMAERGKHIWRAYIEEEETSGRGSSVEDYGQDYDWDEITAKFQVNNHPRLRNAKHWA